MGSYHQDKPNSKVAEVINEYNLTGMGSHLENKWLGKDGKRTSLRDLAELFNQSILESALDGAGETTIEYDLKSTYHILTGEDVSSSDRLRKSRQLERAGIDVDDLRNSFVTHQAIHTYLTKYREVEIDGQELDPERKIKTIERLEGRTAAVADTTLDELIAANHVANREYQIFVDVRTVCEECGSSYRLVELISQGGCTCERS